MVAELAEVAATKGNPNTVSDAAVAALLAEAACRGAVYNVRINLAEVADKSRGEPLLSEASTLLEATAARARSAINAVEQAIASKA